MNHVFISYFATTLVAALINATLYTDQKGPIKAGVMSALWPAYIIWWTFATALLLLAIICDVFIGRPVLKYRGLKAERLALARETGPR